MPLRLLSAPMVTTIIWTELKCLNSHIGTSLLGVNISSLLSSYKVFARFYTILYLLIHYTVVEASSLVILYFHFIILSLWPQNSFYFVLFPPSLVKIINAEIRDKYSILLWLAVCDVDYIVFDWQNPEDLENCRIKYLFLSQIIVSHYL